MAYLGHRPAVGENNSFRILDDISSYVLTFDGSSASAVSLSNETITMTEDKHRYITGQRVTYSNGGGGNIAGLTNGQAYFVINHSSTEIKLASSASNALAGTAVDLTGLGTGSSHTLTLAFDGVNTKFVPTFGNGLHDTLIKRAAQLVISLNGVIQQPHDTATPTTGFGVDALGNIIFSTAPASTDIFWAHVLASNTVTFDSSDNDVDTFTGDGSTTSFTLSKIPPDNRNILVTIDGVVQYPSDAANTRSYNVSENVMTFVAAPGNGTVIQVRHIGYAGPSAGGGSGGVTGFYGRTGNVSLQSTDNIVANDAVFNGNVSIAKTLTYEDVTDIDSVGLITARSGIKDQTLTAGRVVYVGTDGRLVDESSLVYDASTNQLGIGTDNPYHTAILDVFDSSSGTNTDLFSVRGKTSAFLVQCSNKTASNPVWKLRTFAGEDMAFSPGGSGDVGEKVRIRASDGFIGINTTTPTKLVTIKAGAPFVRLEAADTSDKRLDLQVSSSGIATISAEQSSQQLSFKTTGGEALRITSGGKIGIGTDNPDHNLHIYKYGGDAVITLESQGNGNHAALEFFRTSSAGDSKGAGSIYVTGDTSSSEAKMQFGVGYNISHGVFPKMTIMGAGEVGIGTDNPSNPLEVWGSSADILICDTDAYSENSSGAALSLQGNDSAGNRKTLADVRGVAKGANIGEFAIRTRRSGGNLTEALRIDSSGNVGLGGENNPVSLLTLNKGDLGANTTYGDAELIRIEGYGTTNSKSGIGFGRYNGGQNGYVPAAFIGAQTGTWSGHTNCHLVFATRNTTGNDNATERLRITNDGKVGIASEIPEQRLTVAGATDITHYSNTTINNNRLQLGFNAPEGYIKAKNSTGSPAANIALYTTDTGGNTNKTMHLRYDGKVGIGTNNPNMDLHVLSTSDDVARFQSTATGNGSAITLDHIGGSPADNDIAGKVVFNGQDDALNSTTYADIRCITSDVSNGSETAHLDFSTRGLNAFNPILRLNARGSASAPSYTTDDMNGIILDTYNTGNPYPRYFNFIAKSAGDTDSNIGFWTEAVGGSPTEKLRISPDGGTAISKGGGFHATDTGHAGLEVRAAKDKFQLLLSSTSPDATDNQVKIGFKLHPSYQDERIKAAIVVQGTGGGYGQADFMSFCLDTVADNNNTGQIYGDERLRIDSTGFMGPIPRTGAWQGTYVYKQTNQGANYEHKIRGPMSGYLDTEMDTNSVAYIKVQTTGTGVNDAYCYYRWSQDGENAGANLTHIHGNFEGSSNRPYMVLDGEHPCWKTAHSVAYSYVIRVEVTGGDDGETYTSTGSYAAN